MQKDDLKANSKQNICFDYYFNVVFYMQMLTKNKPLAIENKKQEKCFLFCKLERIKVFISLNGLS